MKKWKQLVVFVTILTLVMGTLSFAETGAQTGNSKESGIMTLSGADPTPSVSQNTPTATQPATPPSTETPDGVDESLSNNKVVAKAPGFSDVETKKIAKKLGITVTAKVPAKEVQQDLVSMLETLLASDFGKTEGGESTKSQAKLSFFEITAANEKLLDGKTVRLTLDCTGMVDDNASEKTLRLLHYKDGAWEIRPIYSYESSTKKLTAEFSSFSPFCLAESEVEAPNAPAGELADPKDIVEAGDIPDPAVSPSPTVSENATPTPTEKPGTTGTPTPTPTLEPTKTPTVTPTPEPTKTPDIEQGDPLTTSDAWKLTSSRIANKYNVIVLNWNAAQSGRYEVLYSATPDDANSFRRATTTRKTTYKFTKAQVGVRYGFKIRVKGTDIVSQTLYVTNSMEGRVTAPSAVEVKVKSYNSLEIKWSKVQGVKRYAIYRDGVKIGEKSGTRFVDKGLTTGETYLYEIQPIMMKGAKGTFEGPKASTTGTPKFKAVAGFKVRAVDSASLKVRWNRVKGAEYYTLYKVVKTETGAEVLVPVQGAEHLTRTQFIDTNLEAGTEYSYRVVAHGGRTSVISKTEAGRTKVVKLK